MFKPKTPRAGSVRIGEPPVKGRNYPRKIDHFQFALPVKEGKYYPKDEQMHQVFGAEPKYIGPIFLISDNLVEALNMQLAWWGSGKLKSRRKCFKMLNPLGRGEVDDGRPASQLYKTPDGKGLAYRDRVCLSNECPDFISGKCSGSLCIKFLIPNAPRLGEYWLAAGSYHAINAMFGFIELMRRALPEDHENGSLIGLSKIPLALVLKQDSVRHDGKDTVVYYPELTLDRNLIKEVSEQGIFNALPSLVGNEGKNLLTAGKATSRYQKSEAQAAVYEGSASEIADDGEVVESFEAPDTVLEVIDADVVEADVHEPHAEAEVEAEVKTPVKKEPTEVEPKTPLAKTMPKVEKTASKDNKEKSSEEKKVLDTKSKEEYNNKASSEQTLSEAEAELLEAELEAMASSDSEPVVVEEAAEQTLAQSILDEEAPKKEAKAEEVTASAGSYVLVYQVISGNSTEKKEEKLRAVPEDFEKLKDCQVWMSSGEDKNDVRFIFDSDNEDAMTIKKGFMNAPWAIGKLRFQLSKGVENALRRLGKFVTG